MNFFWIGKIKPPQPHFDKKKKQRKRNSAEENELESRKLTRTCCALEVCRRISRFFFVALGSAHYQSSADRLRTNVKMGFLSITLPPVANAKYSFWDAPRAGASDYKYHDQTATTLERFGFSRLDAETCIREGANAWGALSHQHIIHLAP